MGDIELWRGDCLELMKRVPNGSVDLVVTDPPYLINYKTGRRKNKSHKFCTCISGDDDFNLIANYIKECFRIMKQNTAMYMFCNCEHVDFFMGELKKYFKIKNAIVWVKNNWTAGDLRNAFGKQYEFLIYASKGMSKIRGKRYSDVWCFDRVAGGSLVHQNQKPVPLLVRAITSSSDVGGVVFDGFMGSGTTGVACKLTGRRFIGIEIDEGYYDIARQRIENGVHQENLKSDEFTLF